MTLNEAIEKTTKNVNEVFESAECLLICMENDGVSDLVWNEMQNLLVKISKLEEEI